MLRKTVAAMTIALCFGASAQAKIILDLTPTAATTLTGTGQIGGGFVMSNTNQQPTGTGVIDSFLRIQQTGQERGYNTSVGPPPLDDKQPSGGFTRAITLGEIPIVNIGGVDYRAFLADINQVSNGNISMNNIQIFQSSADVGNSGYTLAEADSSHDAIIGFSTATEVFRMNNAQNVGNNLNKNYEVQIDSNHGSGSGDMFIYVRNSAFAQNNSSFITLFAQFGNPSGTYSSNAGFEEFAVLKGTTITSTPEPSTIGMALTAIGLGLLAARRARRNRAA